MVKVMLPSAEWDTVLYLLHELKAQGMLLNPLIREIEDQVYGQEN